MRPNRLLLTASAIGLSVTLGAIALSVSACGEKGDTGATGAAGSSGTPSTPSNFDITKINHLIVIYQENWSFDGLYSQFPGANGFRFNQPLVQTTAAGAVIPTMNRPLDANGNYFTSSVFTGSSMPVAFFNLADFNAGSNPWASANTITSDITHRYVHEQLQIDGGALDQHLFWSEANSNTGLVPGTNMNSISLSGVDAVAMGLPEEQLAESYTLCDNCFQSAFGGSFLNHQYLISAQTPVFFNASTVAPASISTSVSATVAASHWDTAITQNPVPGSTTDYYAVNTIQPPYAPSNGGLTCPPQTNATIATRLEAASINWKWYSEGWNVMNASTLGGTIGTIPTPSPGSLTFQYHHQPFNYYKAFDPSTPAGLAERAAHLKDLGTSGANFADGDFGTDLANGTLPPVSFVKFAGDDNEHPGYSALLTGQQAVANLVKQVQASSSWKDCAIVITYDEFGGRYDHVKPPTVDAWGPGHRIPMIIVSPFSKFRYVDHTQYETNSILSFIEHRYSLTALSVHDAKANWFTNPFTTTPFANN